MATDIIFKGLMLMLNRPAPSIECAPPCVFGTHEWWGWGLNEKYEGTSTDAGAYLCGSTGVL